MKNIDYQILGLEIAKLFSSTHKENNCNAKFKIGDKIIYKGKRFLFSLNKEYTISGVNDTENGIEYSLYNFPYLVWEEELR